jgi:hypothetical protein
LLRRQDVALERRVLVLHHQMFLLDGLLFNLEGFRGS